MLKPKVSELSGLSTGQIDQLISRYGVGVHGRAVGGGPREFTPADAFTFCIAGRAAAMGLDMPTIRDLVGSLPMPAVDPDTFRQKETFPGFSRGEDLMLIVRLRGGEFDAAYEAPAKLEAATKNTTASLVFPATEIARAVEAAGE